jgi:hypothetical protein
MAAFKVKNLWIKNLWTALLTALSALLASVGLTTVAAAAPQAPVRPALPCQATRRQAARRQARREAVRMSVAAPARRWSSLARDRSLPPTIKQRIRAEAHGSSPATRRLSAIGGDTADDIADGALSLSASPALVAA